MTREEEIKEVAGTYAKDASKRGLLYDGFVDGAQWADQHPNWISVEDDFPPKENNFHVSIDVLATDGETIHLCFYDYDQECWVCFERWCFAQVTHWMALPQVPHIIRPQRQGN